MNVLGSDKTFWYDETENLRELEADGIISRKVYPEVPPKVEYTLTDKGEDLRDVIDAMMLFGEKYKDKFIELNKAWISDMFTLEPLDEKELSNIEKYIDAGGTFI